MYAGPAPVTRAVELPDSNTHAHPCTCAGRWAPTVSSSFTVSREDQDYPHGGREEKGPRATAADKMTSARVFLLSRFLGNAECPHYYARVMEATRTPTKERRLAALRGALREGS